MMFYQFCFSYVYDQINYIQLQNCYDQQSKVTLNKNMRTFTVILNPTNNSICSQFPSDIGANLSMSSLIFPTTLQMIARNFSYKETTELQFTIPPKDAFNNYDIDLYTDETFIVIQLYSFQFVTQVELLLYDELKSDLMNCFSTMQVKVQDTSLKLTLVPTQQCVIQMVAYDLVNHPNSYIKSIIFEFQNMIFDVSINDVVLPYQLQQQADVIIPITSEQHQNLMGEAFYQSFLKFESVQGSQQVELRYMLTDIISAAHTDLLTQSYVHLYDRGFKGFLIILGYDESNINAILSGLDYTSISYRLSGKINANVFQSIKTRQKGASLLHEIDYQCIEGSAEEQAACVAFYLADYNSDNPPQYILDMNVMSSTTVLFTMKVSLIQSYDCWTGGRFRFENDNLIVNSQWAEACYDMIGESCTRDLFLFDKSSSSVLTKLNATVESVIDHDTTLSWSCQYLNACTQLQSMSLMYQLKVGDYFYYNFIESRELNDRKSTQISGIVSGAVLLFVCSVNCVYRIIRTVQFIKKTKRDGRKKNPE
ncbi:Conserved_hypothetical protein [Hexamita inflata]|uniref:Transmembrane protein n=1 Tax=Hexamita inflata TaxID=28002 RepID=A0AA86UFV2_9EUKA|nr:Conserved hypothetical protein [Hexamita inflata]